MVNKQKALLKKKAKRAEHNKQVAAKRAAANIANRKHKQQLASITEFAKGFVKDALSMIQYRQQFMADIKGHIAHVAKLKEEDPVKYQNLSTDGFKAILDKCTAADDKFAALGNIAAKLEDAKTAEERMKAVMENMETLTEAQASLLEMVSEMQEAASSFEQSISGEAPVPTAALDTKDTTEFEGDEKAEVTEERSMEDGEIEVTEEDVKKLGS